MNSKGCVVTCLLDAYPFVLGNSIPHSPQEQANIREIKEIRKQSPQHKNLTWKTPKTEKKTTAHQKEIHYVKNYYNHTIISLPVPTHTFPKLSLTHTLLPTLTSMRIQEGI